MTRPLRIQYPGALYHITSRGNGGCNIFLDDSDRIEFFYYLQNAVKKHNIICHAYCLMGNHFHLLLETPEGNISDAMRDLLSNYSMKLNERYGRKGHLFQSRYFSSLIEKEVYFLEAARYIVNNPVKDGFVDHPSKWNWSSYLATAGATVAPEWLHTNFTLSLFSDKKDTAQKAYSDFVVQKCIDIYLHEDMSGSVLGTKQFKDWIYEEIDVDLKTSEHTNDEVYIGRPMLKDFFLKCRNRRDRNASMIVAHKLGGYSISEIARYLNMHRTSVSRLVNKNATL